MEMTIEDIGKASGYDLPDADESAPSVPDVQDAEDQEEEDQDAAEGETGDEDSGASGEGESAEGEGEQGAGEAEPSIPPKVLVQGASAGLSYEDMIELGSEKAILAAIRLRGDAPKTEESKATEAESADEWFTPKLDDDVEETISAAIKGLNDHTKGVVEKLTGQISVLKEYVQEIEASAFNERVDGAFASVGDSIEEFGVGSVHEITPEQRAARQTVLDTALKFERMDIENGKRLPLKKYLEKAIGVEYSGKAKDSAKKELVKQVAARKKIARPNSAAHSEDPEDDALEMLRSGLQGLRGR